MDRLGPLDMLHLFAVLSLLAGVLFRCIIFCGLLYGCCFHAIYTAMETSTVLMYGMMQGHVGPWLYAHKV